VALDPGVLAGIRAHVGTSPDDSDLEGRWDRHGSVEAVALEVLRGRLADMLAHPADLSVEGDYAERWAKNIDVLSKQVGALAAAVAAGATAGAVSVTRLTRASRSR